TMVATNPMVEYIRSLLHLLPHDEPWRSLSREAAFIAVMAAIVLATEIYCRRDMQRYRSRHFANDLLYSFFYQGGLYNILIYIPFFSFLQKRLSIFDLHVLSSLPPPVDFVVFWLAADFMGYW